MKALAVLVVLARAASAEPGTVQELTAQAHAAASEGECGHALDLGVQVRDRSGAYFESVFASDRALAMCMQSAAQVPHKDPAVALGLSLGLTTAGAALLAFSAHGRDDASAALSDAGLALLVIGPSAGEAYSKHLLNPGLAIRGGAFLVAGIASASFLSSCLDGCTDRGLRNTEGILIATGIAYAAGAIYEIIDAPRAARRHNRRVSLGRF